MQQHSRYNPFVQFTQFVQNFVLANGKTSCWDKLTNGRKCSGFSFDAWEKDKWEFTPLVFRDVCISDLSTIRTSIKSCYNVGYGILWVDIFYSSSFENPSTLLGLFHNLNVLRIQCMYLFCHRYFAYLNVLFCFSSKPLLISLARCKNVPSNFHL